MDYRPKKPVNKPQIIILLSMILILFIGFGVFAYKDKIFRLFSFSSPDSLTTTKKPVENVQANKPLEKKVHFVALGDMIAHDTITANAMNQTGYDYAKYFEKIKTAYTDADIVFCNQESLSSGEDFGISGYPTFNAPTEFAVGLSDGAGCNVINLANNHMGDKGVSAINKTLDVWSNLKPYAIAGANRSVEDQNKVAYFSINDIKFSFLAFADFNNNRNLPDYAVNIYHNDDLIRKLVNEARQNSDFVIVSMHWGVEDSNQVSQDQLTYVDLLASLNVDVVIGTGPHVLQRVDFQERADKKQMLIWYSLGNMLSSQLQVNELIGGIAEFDIETADNNEVTISRVEFTPTYMNYEWTETQATNYDLLARKNAMIYLLNDATEPLARSLLNTTVADRKAYVIETIGDKAVIK